MTYSSVLICLRTFVFHTQAFKMFSLGIEFLGWQFSFNSLKIPFHCTVALILEKSAVSPTVASVKVLCSSFPPPLLLSNVPFVFVFSPFPLFLWTDFFFFICPAQESVFGFLNLVSFIRSGNFSTKTSSNIASAPFSISSSGLHLRLTQYVSLV